MKKISFLMSLLAFAVTALASQPSGFIPFDSRWDNPQYLGYRPANEAESEVNPPRFSWPYDPNVVLEDHMGTFPAREFVLQISTDVSFQHPEVNRRSSWNFDNALSPLAPGKWFWRVGYAEPGQDVNHWGFVHSFSVTAQTPTWDRSAYNDPLKGLISKHPRLGPADGDIAAFRARIQANPLLKPVWDDMTKQADAILNSDWWKEGLPDSDKTPKGLTAKAGSKVFKAIGDQFELATFLYKFNGDQRFHPVIAMALKAAAYPQGGETSPEFNGGSDKWGTRWADDLARVYDWCYDELTPDQRQTLLKAVAWRVKDVLHVRDSWEGTNGGVHGDGVAVFSQSHPFEDMAKSIQALMLIAGDGGGVDGLVAPMMNYMAGVSGSHGPDEAWNEAGGYAFFKGDSELQAALMIDLTIPDLKLHTSDWFNRLGYFWIDLDWPGLKKQGFGDYTIDMNNPDRRGDKLKCMMLDAVFTQNGVFRKVWDQMAQNSQPRNLDQSLFLVFADRRGIPAPSGTRPDSTIYPEAGWMFAGNFDPSDSAAAKNGSRIAVIGRPRGGYSHSYAHDGAYIWHALGQTLTAGGGATVYGDPFARNSLSHNDILVEGRGQADRGFDTMYPISARPLFWQESKKAVSWSIDLTGAFLCKPNQGWGKYDILSMTPNEWGYPNLAYWRRHFIFFDNRYLAIYDEIAVKDGTAPARFTWLHNFPANITFTTSGGKGAERFLKYQVGNVQAAVYQRSPQANTDSVASGRQTMINPITGHDYWPDIDKAYTKGERPEHLWDVWADQSWRVQTAPLKKTTFLTILAANHAGEAVPEVEFTGDDTARIKVGDQTQTISFGSGEKADFTLDAAAMDAFADATDPYRLPPAGPTKSVQLDQGYVNAMWLRKDDFQEASWLNRWSTQGLGLVYADTNGLHIDAKELEKLTLRAALPEKAIIALEVAPSAKGTKNEVTISVGSATVTATVSASSTSWLIVVADGKLRLYVAGKKIAESPLGTGAGSSLQLSFAGERVSLKSLSVGKIL